MKDKKVIQYTTPEQQIQLLKDKHLYFNNESKAIECLNMYGYYNIINSYKGPYIEKVNGKKMYRSGTSFEQIFSLFSFDHSLRNAIMASMTDLEEHLKACVAEVITESFGPDQRNYLKWDNYRDRKNSKERFSLKGILASLNATLASDKDPIKYYRENYSVVPPWILFKGVYFSTLINFIRLFKTNEKSKLIQKLYGMSENDARLPIASTLLSQSLFMCLEFRNLSAHGGRVYNYQPSHSMPNATDLKDIIILRDKPIIYTDNSGIGQLVFALSLLRYQNPFYSLCEAINNQINVHLQTYPSDQEYIESVIGSSIERTHPVWLNYASEKFHLNPTCSGLKNTYKMDFSEAINLGYQPCKKCISGWHI